MDAEDDGFAQGLSNCLTRDGQSTMAAVLNMGNFNIVNLLAPSQDGHAVNKAYADLTYAAKGAGGAGLPGNSLTLIADFSSAPLSGFYRFSGTSLNKPTPAGGGAIPFNRSGTDDSNSQYGWLAMGITGAYPSVPELWMANAGTAGAEIGSWVRVLDSVYGDGRYAQMAATNVWSAIQKYIAGTVTTPVVAWNGDPTQGLWFSTGQVHVSIGGVDAAQIDAAGTAAGDAQTVMTREKGDARYRQLADGVPQVIARATGASGGGITGGAYGIASISKTATGRYTVTFATAQAGLNYVPMLSVLGGSPATGGLCIWYYAKTTGGFAVGIGDNSSDLAQDSEFGVVVVL